MSGGQRQRLSIARALLRRPAIYLFDDSFSALDLATEARLRAALRPHTKDATVIMVAQRVASIVDADQIIVLDAGAIVGRGRHTELLADLPDLRRDRDLADARRWPHDHRRIAPRAASSAVRRRRAVRSAFAGGAAAEVEELQGLGAPLDRPARARHGRPDRGDRVRARRASR